MKPSTVIYNFQVCVYPVELTRTDFCCVFYVAEENEQPPPLKRDESTEERTGIAINIVSTE